MFTEQPSSRSSQEKISPQALGVLQIAYECIKREGGRIRLAITAGGRQESSLYEQMLPYREMEGSEDPAERHIARLFTILVKNKQYPDVRHYDKTPIGIINEKSPLFKEIETFLEEHSS